MSIDRLRSNPLLSDPAAPRQRFMMVLSYDGKPFYGWQVQPRHISVQESIESALRTVLQTPLHIVGAGRTDTGVNARHMVAHFDVPEDDMPTLLSDEKSRAKFVYTLNAILKPSVTLHHIVPVHSDAHARFDAKSRTYRYYVHTVPDPFRASTSRYIYKPLDFESMNREARSLLGLHDFTSFSKLHTDTANNLCEVSKAEWVKYGPAHYYFEITANRFLRNMVRAVVGTLLEVGTGKKGAGHIRDVMKAMNRSDAGSSVPGNALYLWDITYPYPLPDNPLPQNL